MTREAYFVRTVKRTRDKNLQICVVGLGTIGLVLATFLGEAGFSVVGLDISPTRVEQVNSGRVSFEYRSILQDVLRKRKLRATSDPKAAISRADAIFICVPTSLDADRRIDITNLRNAAESIGKNMRRGALIVMESTVSIGMTRDLGKVMEVQSGMSLGKDFGLACCPERYNPTLSHESHPLVAFDARNLRKVRHSFDQLERVIGGVNQESAVAAKAIYDKILKAGVTLLSSTEAAEATKLLENIFRDVNIALINELATILPDFGLDTYEVIEAAKTKPFAFLPHYPGPGVGGDCIPVVPWFLINQADQAGLPAGLLREARKVNDSMPMYVVKLLERELEREGRKLKSSRVALLGLAYKKNINDVRWSPALSLMKILKARKAKVVICDPIVAEYPSGHKLTPLSNAFSGADAAVLVTDHDVFRDLDFKMIKRKMRTPIFIDGRHLYDGKAVKAMGLDFKCLGVA